MFELTLFDARGKELAFGDIVTIYARSGIQFFCEVKYLPEEQAISPFHTFSFDKVYKVDSLPDNAVELKEERYKCWTTHDESFFSSIEETIEKHNNYLLEWREVESRLRDRMWRIRPIQKQLDLLS